MNNHDLMKQPPIVVFGTGGSGTRVVAEILKEAGCFIGYNLNTPLDNQDFGFLLSGRVDWIVDHFPFEDDSALSYLVLFKKIFFQKSLALNEFILLVKIAVEYLRGQSQASFRRRPISERLLRGKRLLQAVLPGGSLDLPNYQKWAFKSPEAIYLIKPIVNFFSGVKLIHLIRDGRDMVCSKNLSRLQYFELFNIEDKDPVKSQLSHWGAINSWVNDYSKEALPEEQYLLIKYENLCKFPQETVDKILAFSELKCNNLDKLYKIPRFNPSINRWEKYKEDLKNINTSDLIKFGYL